MAKIISFTQFKGGCGKTTSTFNIGFALANAGSKVLLIDIDPQAHLTFFAGISENLAEEYSITEVLTDKKELPIHKLNDNISIVPSHISLEDVIQVFPSFGLEGYKRLIKPISQIAKDFDYILIDCPPSLGILTQLALISSDYAFIPSQAEGLSGNGLVKQVNNLKSFKEDNNLGFVIGGIFLTRFDSRKNLNKLIEDFVTKNLSEYALQTKIRENIALAESPLQHQDIFTYAPDSKGAEDYKLLAEEMLTKI
jgi:chromosome partitioning protein